MYKELNSTKTLIQRTTMEAPRLTYVLHRTGCSQEVSLPTVSKRLGHTDVHTTASIYSHALPKDDLKAAEAWEANFKKAADAANAVKAS